MIYQKLITKAIPHNYFHIKILWRTIKIKVINWENSLSRKRFNYVYSRKFRSRYFVALVLCLFVNIFF